MECTHCKHRITSSYHPQSNGLVECQNRTTTQFLLKNMDCQDDWVKMIPTMMASHRHTVHSSTNVEVSTILQGKRPNLATDMKLRSDEYFERGLNDQEIEQIENVDYKKVLGNFNFVKGDMYNYASKNISSVQIRMKKYYDMRHLRNFSLKKGDKVLKILCKNLERKGGKKEKKFSSPYIVVDISDLGVATLRTVRGCVLKRGVPIKQLQKFNKGGTKYNGEKEDDDSDESTEVKPQLKRRLFPDDDGGSDMEDFINNDNVKNSTRIKTETIKKGTVTVENEKTETVNIKTGNEDTVNMATLKKETVMEQNTYYSCGQGSKLVESKAERRLGAKEDNVRRNYYPNDIRPDSTSELSGVVHYEENNPDILFNNGTLSTPKSRYKMGGNNNKMRLCLKKKLQKGSPEVDLREKKKGEEYISFQ